MATANPDALEAEVLRWIDRGYVVERQTDTSAVVVKGHRPNHILHLILTILTLGFWGLFVWLPIAVFGGVKRKLLLVQPDGSVAQRKA